MSKYTAEQVRDWLRSEATEEYESNSLESAGRLNAMADAIATLLRERESAKLPEGLRERIERAWHDHDEDGRVSISMADAQMLVEQVLAAAPKPEKEREMKWYPFDRLKGSLQKRPPERRLVLVQTAGGPDNMGIVYPPSIAVGYRKDADGDKQCPYFVVPGIGERNGEIVGWCDCLGDDFQVSMSLRGRFWFTPYPNKEQP